MRELLTDHSRLLAATAAATVFAAILVLERRRSRSKLPPGPPLEPVIGGLRTMPSTYQWLTFAQWSKKWGMCIVGLTIALQAADIRSGRRHHLHDYFRYSGHRGELH